MAYRGINQLPIENASRGADTMSYHQNYIIVITTILGHSPYQMMEANLYIHSIITLDSRYSTNQNPIYFCRKSKPAFVKLIKYLYWSHSYLIATI